MMRAVLKRIFRVPSWSGRFYQYLFSYILLIVMLLVIVGSVIYGSFISVLREEVEGSVIATLTQIKEAMDTRTSEMNRMALQIAANPLLTPFMVAEGGYGTYQAVQDLKKYRSANDFVHEVVLYYGDGQASTMYAASGIHSIDYFFRFAYPFSQWGKEEFVSTLSSLEKPVIRSVEQAAAGGAPSSGYVLYLHPLSVDASRGYGVVLFIIKEDELNSMISKVLKDYSGFTFILDENGRPVTKVLSNISEEQAGSILEAFPPSESGEAIQSVSVNRTDYSMVQLKSETNGWSYITVMPTDQFLGKVNETRAIFHYTVVAVLLLGLLLALAFSIRNYRPLLKLAGGLADRRIIKEWPRKTDEISLISKAIGEVTRENQGLLEKLNSQASLLKASYVLSLVEGKVKSTEEWDEIREALDWPAEYPHYAVMLLLIDNYDRFVGENTKPMQDIIKYSLIQMAENLSQRLGAGWGAEYKEGRGIVILLNIREGLDELNDLADLGTKVRLFANQHYQVGVTVGIGGMFNNITKLPQSLTQADHAARCRLVKGGNQVICYSEVEKSKESIIWYPLESEKLLVKAIKQGNSDEVQTVIRDMMSSMVNQPISIEKVEFIGFDMINTVMKTLLEMDMKIEAADLAMERFFVSRFETVEALEHKMIEFCDRVCEYVERHKESKNIALLDQLVAYVDRHYHDNTINLEQIAGEFGFSPSYLTRFFKNQTGDSLMRYIDQIRMEKAKELLRTTDMNLGEIIERVGYIDPTNFIRKFKKLEGVTPIQYRNLIQAGRLSLPQ
ncbi:helix-turn-helix domain-containing protein [Paenibacillus residui]|uniref:Helix-turn-helix domain-containing protein n=1 Tax=Paenibacillus residui TaxID=629724 RepID=A0ABW3D5W0_9BACL